MLVNGHRFSVVKVTVSVLEVVLSVLVSLVLNTLDSVVDIVGCVVNIGCEVFVRNHSCKLETFVRV